uniref:Uncharacterized protein n=1 Tax=Rhipicephalus pulchellus TaxID=72859 RepID=L7LYZ4_RHIPC
MLIPAFSRRCVLFEVLLVMPFLCAVCALICVQHICMCFVYIYTAEVIFFVCVHLCSCEHTDVKTKSFVKQLQRSSPPKTRFNLALATN